MSGEVMTRQSEDNSSAQENGDSDGTDRPPSRHGSTISRSSKLTLLRRESVLNLFSNFKKPREKCNGSTASQSEVEVSDSDDKSAIQSRYKVKISKGWSTIVIIVLVEAKGLPDPPDDGYTHRVYGKFQLGSQSYKSKSTKSIRQPKWGERFKFTLRRTSLLQISLWDTGKKKNFMGNCSLELMSLERDRTHEIWQRLDDGFGSVHLSVTLCTIKNENAVASIPEPIVTAKDDYAWHKLNNDWSRVGQMHVKVIGAKGLSGRPNAYAVLAVDNERVQTHSCRARSDPVWDKSYLFNIYDITSTLDIKIFDSSLVNIFQDGFLGRISIPLLQLKSGTPCWYALKDKSKKYGARGNCPRILVETTLFWNPVKSALRVFQPKEVKHIKKPTKFDVALVYNNIEFVRDIFLLLYDINESIKRVFEWENKEASFLALVLWLLFWFYFEAWMGPVFLIAPFIYFWFFGRGFDDSSTALHVEQDKEKPIEKSDEKTLTRRIQGLPEMTLTITNGIEYLASVAERLYNLASFKVPFLSYVAIAILSGTSFILYFLPFNYLLIALGLYKFTRKHLNPDRVLNNDLLDFISRIPDNEILKEWRQLSVPEPIQGVDTSIKSPSGVQRQVWPPPSRDLIPKDSALSASLARSFSTK